MARMAIWRGRLARRKGIIQWGAFLALWPPMSAVAIHGGGVFGLHPGSIALAVLLLGAGTFFGAGLVQPFLILPSVKSKGYKELSLLDLRHLLKIFAVSDLARLPLWEDLQALPGARPGAERSSIKRVLADALHDPFSLRDHLRARGYRELGPRQVWLLASLYGHLPLLELPAWSDLRRMPGVDGSDQFEALKATLARCQPMIRGAAVYGLHGDKIERKPFEELPDGFGDAPNDSA